MRFIGFMLLLIAGCSCDYGDWIWIASLASAGMICFMVDWIIRERQRRFKEAVEREVNRRIYYYKKIG